MILYDNPEEAFNHLDRYFNEFSELATRLVNSRQYNSCWEEHVPDMPDGKLIIFFSYKGRVVFYVEREGKSYLREVPENDKQSFLITACTFDLPSGTLRNVEDVLND